MSVLLLVAGLILLIFGGDYLVKGASGIALRLRVQPMLVGLTVVALGTSAPELVVSVQAAFDGKPDISIGNVVGSNIANIGLILGVTVLIFPMAIRRRSLSFDWVVLMLASLAFYFLALDGLLSRSEGIMLFAGLACFIGYSIYDGRKESKAAKQAEDVEASPSQKWVWLIAFVIFGSIGLVVGAEWFLEGAETIARDFGIPDRVIAISLVAFGTSIPELSASVIAAFKKQQEISLGNIIGSNIFNLLAVLGITAGIHPISVSPDILSNDIFWMLGITFLILPLGFMGYRFRRIDGFVFLSGYVIFITLLLLSV